MEIRRFCNIYPGKPGYMHFLRSCDLQDLEILKICKLNFWVTLRSIIDLFLSRVVCVKLFEMKTLHTTTFIMVIAFCTSCAVLPPSGPNVPLFQEKGEKMISASLIAGQETVGIDVKGAIATGDKFYLSGTASVVSFGEGYTGLMTEFGTGIFSRMGENTVFDISGGIGYGTAISDQFRKVYFQPAIGYRVAKIEIAGGLKMSYVNTHLDMSFWDEPQSEWIEEYSNNFYLEPFLLARIGGERTKFQVGANMPTLVASDGGFTMPTPTVTLGAILRFGKKK